MGGIGALVGNIRRGDCGEEGGDKKEFGGFRS